MQLVETSSQIMLHKDFHILSFSFRKKKKKRVQIEMQEMPFKHKEK